MPLNFNEHIVAPENIDQKPRAIRSSAPILGAVCGVLPQTFVRQDTERSALEARALRSKEHDQSFRKLRQLIPSHRAFAFLAPQMGLREQFAQIFVACSVFDEQGQNPTVFHFQFAANDRPNILFACCNRKALRPVNSIPIEQRQRWH